MTTKSNKSKQRFNCMISRQQGIKRWRNKSGTFKVHKLIASFVNIQRDTIVSRLQLCYQDHYVIKTTVIKTTVINYVIKTTVIKTTVIKTTVIKTTVIKTTVLAKTRKFTYEVLNHFFPTENIEDLFFFKLDTFSFFLAEQSLLTVTKKRFFAKLFFSPKTLKERYPLNKQKKFRKKFHSAEKTVGLHHHY